MLDSRCKPDIIHFVTRVDEHNFQRIVHTKQPSTGSKKDGCGASRNAILEAPPIDFHHSTRDRLSHLSWNPYSVLSNTVPSRAVGHMSRFTGLTTAWWGRVPRAAALGYRMTPRCGYAPPTRGGRPDDGPKGAEFESPGRSPGSASSLIVVSPNGARLDHERVKAPARRSTLRRNKTGIKTEGPGLDILRKPVPH